MYRKTEPKNKNITVRVTRREKFEFSKAANFHELSISNWANHILSKHKDSYGESENLEELIEGIDLNIKTMEFINQILEELQIEHKTLYNKTLGLAVPKMRITERIIKMNKFKRRIRNEMEY